MGSRELKYPPSTRLAKDAVNKALPMSTRACWRLKPSFLKLITTVAEQAARKPITVA